MRHRTSPTLSTSRLLAALALSVIARGAGGATEPEPFVVFYANEVNPTAFDRYELIVLDGEHHPPLEPLVESGKKVLGYVSLGEVDSARQHFAAARAGGFLLAENPRWKGSYMVNLRSPRWAELVLERIVPDVLREGFDGLFLDTLDNAPHLERLDPDAFSGMTAAAARLVVAIRQRFPGALLMMNRGYELLPTVDVQIDYLLGESVRADYDFERERYGLVSETLYRQQVETLQEAKRRQPRLRVMTLDYWDPEDTDGIRDIYRQQRDNGFEPYVATLELDRIVPEPQPLVVSESPGEPPR